MTTIREAAAQAELNDQMIATVTSLGERVLRLEAALMALTSSESLLPAETRLEVLATLRGHWPLPRQDRQP